MQLVDGRTKPRYGTRYLLLVLITLIGSGCLARPAGAAIGPELFKFGEEGTGAGQFEGPMGIAADPTTGHLFVVDSAGANSRINEFTAWGEFVKAWGWGVADGTSEELQVCANACFAGKAGGGAGQLKEPGGIALSSNGDVYVFEVRNHRVQVFSPAGEFLRMFGGGVNHTTGADICTAADEEGGDVCGVGVEGTGPAEFVTPFPPSLGDYLDIDSAGTVYVGDRDRIQEFELDGTFKTEIALPHPGNPEALSIDPSSGDIYFAYGGESQARGEVRQALRLSSSGAVVDELPEKINGELGSEGGTWSPTALAADPKGNVYLAQEPAVGDNGNTGSREPRLLELDSTGQIIDSCCFLPLPAGGRLQGVTTNVVTAAGGVDVYLAKDDKHSNEIYVEVRGPAPDKWSPPLHPPDIVGQFASSVEGHSATLMAEINPNFWADTHYYLEYGLTECRLGGCTKAPAPPGALLESGIVSNSVTTEPIDLSSLSPGTTYHYRFVAVSGGGGPVYGEDPDGKGSVEPTFEEGRERTFTTYAPEPSPVCPTNQAFRTGPGAGLPDCRAYEVVSPADKLGGDIVVQEESLSLPAKLDQAAADGNKLTYTSYRAFVDPVGAGYQSQYLSTRTSTGWATENISPPKEGPWLGGGSLALDAPYKAFLDDLSIGWLRQDAEPVLAPGGVPGYSNLYKNVFGEGYAAVTTTEPSNKQPASYALDVQGFSADGRRTVFAAQGKLTANASENTNVQLYESLDGIVRLVSLRPNGAASSADSTAGSKYLGVGGASGENRGANVTHAVSDDGLKIYWSEGGAGEGKIYVRIGGTKTVQVSAGPATFWAGTPSGAEAIYTEAGALKLFNLSSGGSSTLATSVRGVVGESEDLSRIYFVSTGALAAGAIASEPNLYLYEAGQPIALVAVLSQEPPLNPGVADKTPQIDAVAPWRHTSRVTPNGGAVIFMSRSGLAGADTIDAASGAKDAELYRWDIANRDLRCVSCSPAGARPTGRQLLYAHSPTGYWFGSMIPGWEMQSHAPRALSDDGNRVFFESTSQLVLADTNERGDVYEWEAPGTGECSLASVQFSSRSGGCVFLISSGQDPTDSHFVDAEGSGGNLFFTTSQSLVSSDPDDLVDVYDARVGGGIPNPAVPVPCDPDEGAGNPCQTSSSVPLVPPVGSSQAGPGNHRYPAKCKKGFVRRRGRCIRKRRHHRASAHRHKRSHK